MTARWTMLLRHYLLLLRLGVSTGDAAKLSARITGTAEKDLASVASEIIAKVNRDGEARLRAEFLNPDFRMQCRLAASTDAPRTNPPRFFA